jgi:hypothetical protein
MDGEKVTPLALWRCQFLWLYRILKIFNYLFLCFLDCFISIKNKI